jgi:hypothetical protein
MSVVILKPETPRTDYETSNSMLGVSGEAIWLELLKDGETQNQTATKVTASQYTQYLTLGPHLEGLLAEAKKSKEVGMMKLLPHPLFATSGLVFLGISIYFWSHGATDLGIASLGPAVTALLASVFAIFARLGK